MSGLACRWAEQVSKDYDNPVGDAPRLDRAAVAVLKEIAARANNDLCMWHSVESLARATRYSERMARYALRDLEEFPLIACVGDDNGGKKPRKYELLISPEWIKKLQGTHPGKHDAFGSKTETYTWSKAGLIDRGDGVTMRWRPHCAPANRFSEVFAYLFSEACEIECPLEAQAILFRSRSNDGSISGLTRGARVLVWTIFLDLLRNKEGGYDPNGPILSLSEVFLACPGESDSEITSYIDELRNSGALDADTIPRLRDLARTPISRATAAIQQSDQGVGSSLGGVWRLMADEQQQQLGTAS